MTAVRIQLRRTRGWRKPKGSVIVSRGPGKKWGNPFKLATKGGIARDHAHAVALYREFIANNPEVIAAARRELRGKTLACWCPLDGPCHADVLIEMANSEEAR